MSINAREQIVEDSSHGQIRGCLFTLVCSFVYRFSIGKMTILQCDIRNRFNLYTLCSDSTRTIPIIWPNNEILRLTGKTIYDVEVDEEQVKKCL